MSLVKVPYDDKEVTAFIVRPRNNQKIKHVGYVPLIKKLFELLTDDQMSNLIKCQNNKYYMLHDDLVDCFNYQGYEKIPEGGGRCICGHTIIYNHIIVNCETMESFTVGSSCCYHWITRSHLSYTKNMTGKILKKCFKVLKENYTSSPKFTFGKYKGRKIRQVVKHDKQYCRWVIRTVDSSKLKDTLSKYLSKTY